MNILLWVLQIGLAIKFVSVAYTHGLRPDATKMGPGLQRLGRLARPLLTAIALGAFLGGGSLILPLVNGTLAWLTSWTATLLALSMLPAVGFHLSCREDPKVVVSLIISLLTAFLALGRWVIAPL